MPSNAQSAAMTPAERLTIRVSNMINSPRAQAERRAVIHRLDTDPEAIWEAMLEALNEQAELQLTLNDDGTVLVEWAEGYEREAEEWREGSVAAP